MAQLAQGMDSRRRFSNVDGDSDGESSENDSTPSPSNRTEEAKRLVLKELEVALLNKK